MKTSTLAIVASLLWISEALHLQKRTDGPSRAIGFPVHRRTIKNPVARDRLRRRGSVQASLDNEKNLYFANATLGTPAQSLRLHLDTGSSDLWVNSPSSTLCRSRGSPCLEAGSYNANDSSTYSYIASNFNISYVDGSGAYGDYVTDTFSIGGITLPSLQFGIGYQSSSDEGILGIGYQSNEVQVGRAGEAAYNNLPAQMVADGLIASNAYSLWLNDLDSSTGSILFGGIDTDHFSGTLRTLPIQKESAGYFEFLITLTGVSLGDTVIASGQQQAVLLDSGSTLTYLPDSITRAIYDEVSATYDSTEGAAYVDCNLINNSSSLEFTFSSPTISVSMDELVIPVTDTAGHEITFQDGTPACLFGIAPASGSVPVLGDTFLRSAYVVYDLGNNEISLAQTVFNVTTTNIVEITTGSAAVPDSTDVVDPATASTYSGSSSSGSGAEGVLTKSSSAAAARRTVAPAGKGWGGVVVGVGAILAAL